MGLPNPNMDFTAFDTLPAASLDDLVENIEALADGSGLDNGAITDAKMGMTGTTDANGWDVLDFGTHRLAWKSGTITGGSRTAGTAWSAGGTTNLPVGCSTVVDIKNLSYSFRMTSSAYALGINVESSTSATSVSWTAVNNGSGTIDFGSPEYWCQIIF